uniref:Uncharacterized protein n=1 Tax=Vitrella brassicaformis TaxID=1169539 RepID=A0A7S1JR09_9ALVE
MRVMDASTVYVSKFAGPPACGWMNGSFLCVLSCLSTCLSVCLSVILLPTLRRFFSPPLPSLCLPVCLSVCLVVLLTSGRASELRSGWSLLPYLYTNHFHPLTHSLTHCWLAGCMYGWMYHPQTTD